MSMSATANGKLIEIFRLVLELPPNTDVTSLEQIDAPSWDSLAHISLVSAMESEFGTTIDASDALNITSFAAAQRIVDERGL